MSKTWRIIARGKKWAARRVRAFIPRGTGLFGLLTMRGLFVIRFTPFRGLSVGAYYSPGRFWWGGLNNADRVYEAPDVKKVKVGERSAVRHLAALETNVLHEYLAIVEFLSLLQYEDGSPRQPGYLGMWVQGSAWVCRVIDKDTDATLTVEGRTLDEALGLLQLLLTADDAPWEQGKHKKRK